MTITIELFKYLTFELFNLEIPNSVEMLISLYLHTHKLLLKSSFSSITVTNVPIQILTRY